MPTLTFEQITPEWLTDILIKHGSLTAGCVAAVEQKRDTSITAHNATLHLAYSPDAKGSLPAKLFFKRHHEGVEAQFYQNIARELTDSAILECYDAQYDETGGHLLLQFVEITHFVPPDAVPMPFRYCQMIAEAMADVHSQWWQHPRLTEDIGSLARDVPAFMFERATNNFANFVDSLGDRLSDKRCGYLEKILTTFPKYRPESPKTLVHGDPHWWNFLYPHAPAKDKLYLIDWAVWNINFGVSDIAYTIATQCYPERRSRFEQPIVRHYHERLLSNGVSGYSWERCWEDYRRMVIDHCLWPVMWHGWKLPTTIWWPSLECVLSAFEDLHCEELL